MPRYIFVTDGGLVYGDTKAEPGPEPQDPIAALRVLDGNIGEPDLVYTEVARDDADAGMHVYRAAGTVRDVERDAVYVTSLRIEQPSPRP